MALGYLISPVIQVEDVNGKPLVGGRIRVYEAGTTNPYITYKDWMGDRNPAEVILDAKGMCVLIADDTKTYDIYCEDRERVEQWSRLNVNVGQGGGGASGITNITSHDGSITVVRSGSTVDITLNDGEPSAIIARSRELDSDGHFVFVGPPANLVGDDLGIGDGYVRGNARWYHYDAMVRIDWQTPQNASKTISITGPDSVETVEFDLTFGHTEWITLAADYQVVNDGDALAFGISGMPEGMTAEIVSLSVHSIVALDSEDHGEQYSAGNGITIQSGVIAVDPTVVQEKLEAGANISIVGNVISATADPQQPADWAATEGVTRILNKPDLDIYATHSEVTYGLAQKQDTISDLSTIRSGAAAGATAVQPSEMTSALAGKQDVISDLSTIRSGAAKGATSVQPADLAPYAVASDVETALAGKQDVISDLSTIRSGASAGATAVQPATMNSALAGKQDTISDLATIRSGASAGATAVQPATMNSALAGKQDVISDLSDIRSGAEAGATAVQPATMNTALAGKQDVISDLSDIRSGASAGATAVQPADMNTALAGKQDVISDLATIRSGAAAGATAVQPATMNTALAGKEDAANKSQTLDPTSATEFPSSAATASFVNSSVATNTATFRGNFKLTDLGLTYPATNAQIEAALDAHTWPVGVVPTNNDYVYVEIENPQTTGIDDVVERFKYDGSYWHYEYTLNNSSFTAAEKAAIDSGIDSAKVAIYDAHVANGDIHVTATEKATWNAKQDAINDLSTIRSGAAAGATAVQDPDYVHTDENFTSAEKTKLSGIEAGAQVNVNADWNAASGTDAYIANKPQNLVQDASYVHTDENFTSSDKSKLAGIEAGAEVNVKPDWNAAAGSDGEILNKPSLATVATTGAFSDLSGKPTVDQTYSASSANAQSGVAVAQAIAGVNAVPASTSADSSKVLTVNSIGTPEWAAAQAPISAGSGIDITNNTVSAKVDGTTVTLNGSGQLQATQPTVDQTYNSASANAQSGTAVAGAIAGKEDEFSVGDGLEFTSDGQGNRVLQVEAPVDIVAGPGIVIDNPDGNTLRVSVAQADETVLWETTSADVGTVAPIALSESIYNFEKIKIVGRLNGNNHIGAPMSWEWYTTDIPVGSYLNCFGLPLNDYDNFSLGIYLRNSVECVSANNSLTHTKTYSWQLQGTTLTNQTTEVWGQLRYFRVVGIHRIASN